MGLAFRYQQIKIWTSLHYSNLKNKSSSSLAGKMTNEAKLETFDHFNLIKDQEMKLDSSMTKRVRMIRC